MKLPKWFYALWRRQNLKRTYPRRERDMCVCGRMITRCKNGRFVRHVCRERVFPIQVDETVSELLEGQS